MGRCFSICLLVSILRLYRHFHWESKNLFLWCGSTKARASVSAVLLHGGSCAITTAQKVYNDAKGILVEKVYRSTVCELLGVLDRDQHLQYLPF